MTKPDVLARLAGGDDVGGDDGADLYPVSGYHDPVDEQLDQLTPLVRGRRLPARADSRPSPAEILDRGDQARRLIEPTRIEPTRRWASCSSGRAREARLGSNSRRGRIINVSSGAANSSMAHATGYSASKAAVTNWAGGLAAAAKEHGIAVFAWDPGFVRTAMSEFLAESDEVRRWFGDTFQQWFETGQDIAIERSAAQFMLLASGRLEALSGRQLGVEQDLLDVAHRAAEIERTGQPRSSATTC